MWKYNELIDNGKQYKVKAVSVRGCDNITENKLYTTVNGVEAGIFSDSPYISIIGDDNKVHVCHSYRFEIIEEVN